ncbi:MAG: single-stranded DNA-binding protein [Candidatus Binataceae bacterium]|jgi:single-strand DNA-binding protein
MAVNKAILVGNLGRDPEIRYLPSGQTVANFTLATSDSYSDRAGARQERTDWHNIVVYGKQAELCGQYLKKGRQVYVEGRISNRQWEAKDGTGKRYRTEIVAQRIQFLGGRAGAAANGGMDEPADFGPADMPHAMDDEDIPF